MKFAIAALLASTTALKIDQLVETEGYIPPALANGDQEGDDGDDWDVGNYCEQHPEDCEGAADPVEEKKKELKERCNKINSRYLHAKNLTTKSNWFAAVQLDDKEEELQDFGSAVDLYKKKYMAAMIRDAQLIRKDPQGNVVKTGDTCASLGVPMVFKWKGVDPNAVDNSSSKPQTKEEKKTDIQKLESENDSLKKDISNLEAKVKELSK